MLPSSLMIMMMWMGMKAQDEHWQWRWWRHRARRRAQGLSPLCSRGGSGSSRAAVQNPGNGNREQQRRHIHGGRGGGHREHSGNHMLTLLLRMFLYLSHHCLQGKSLTSTLTFTNHGRYHHLIITRKFQGWETQGLCHQQDKTDITIFKWMFLESFCTSSVDWITSIW